MTKFLGSILLLVVISSGTLAVEEKRKPNSKTDVSKALTCQLEYKSAGTLIFRDVSEDSGNWILGEKSTATLKDPLKISEVSFESFEKDKKDFFRLRISQKKREMMNAVFDWQGMQVTLPINVRRSDSEDPPTYDQMRVTCETSYMAG